MRYLVGLENTIRGCDQQVRDRLWDWSGCDVVLAGEAVEDASASYMAVGKIDQWSRRGLGLACVN
jgi:hypothetical protein